VKKKKIILSENNAFIKCVKALFTPIQLYFFKKKKKVEGIVDIFHLLNMGFEKPSR
jgi:hypothetical protein